MTTFRWAAISVLALALVFAGCKKDEADAEGVAAAKKVEKGAAKSSKSKKKAAKPDKKAAKAAKKDKKAAKADKKSAKADKAAVGEAAGKGAPTATPGRPQTAEPATGQRFPADAPMRLDGADRAAPTAARGRGDHEESPVLGPRRDLAARLAERERPAPGREDVPAAKPGKAAKAAPPTAKKGAAAPGLPSGPPLEIVGLLTATDVGTITKSKARFVRSELAGIPGHAGYGSIHYRESKGERFGVSVQVWKDDQIRDSHWRFKQMLSSYPNVTENDSVTNRTFFSYWKQLYTLVFVDQARRATVSVTCDRKLCSPEQLLELALRVRDRLKHI